MMATRPGYGRGGIGWLLGHDVPRPFRQLSSGSAPFTLKSGVLRARNVVQGTACSGQCISHLLDGIRSGQVHALNINLGLLLDLGDVAQGIGLVGTARRHIDALLRYRRLDFLHPLHGMGFEASDQQGTCTGRGPWAGRLPFCRTRPGPCRASASISAWMRRDSSSAALRAVAFSA